MLVDNSGKTVDISDAKSQWMGELQKRFGALITRNEDGELVIANAPGREINNPKVIKELERISNKIFNSPNVVGVQRADDLKRAIWKLSFSDSPTVNTSDVKALTRDIGHNIDSKLDATLGDEYKTTNDKLQKIINLQDNMERRLGVPINYETGLRMHGSSIMKRSMQSNADSGIKEIFRQVKDITGGKYDLAQEAAYAEAAMKAVGDPRAYSLLEETGSIGNTLAKLGGHKAQLALDLGNLAVKPIGKIASGGKDNADYLIDYYRKAQGKKRSNTEIANEAYRRARGR
jgi:hypothetical protein